MWKLVNNNMSDPAIRSDTGHHLEFFWSFIHQLFSEYWIPGCLAKPAHTFTSPTCNWTINHNAAAPRLSRQLLFWLQSQKMGDKAWGQVAEPRPARFFTAPSFTSQVMAAATCSAENNFVQVDLLYVLPQAFAQYVSTHTPFFARQVFVMLIIAVILLNNRA